MGLVSVVQRYAVVVSQWDFSVMFTDGGGVTVHIVVNHFYAIFNATVTGVLIKASRLLKFFV